MKKVLITGSSRGIGAEIAKRLVGGGSMRLFYTAEQNLLR